MDLKTLSRGEKDLINWVRDYEKNFSEYFLNHLYCRNKHYFGDKDWNSHINCISHLQNKVGVKNENNSVTPFFTTNSLRQPDH